MDIIFLGPPGVGKGTVANSVMEKKCIIHISTGDLLREAVKRGTELGKKAKWYMDSGQLVPDDIIINLLKERILGDDCKNGFILDGFPRTIQQAKALEGEVSIDGVLNFKAKESTIIKRLLGRRTCKKCDAIYHTTNIPPKKEGICDKCGGKLFLRDDDRLESIKKRLEVYNQQTKPLIKYYEDKRLLTTIDTDKPLDDIIQDTLAVLKS